MPSMLATFAELMKQISAAVASQPALPVPAKIPVGRLRPAVDDSAPAPKEHQPDLPVVVAPVVVPIPFIEPVAVPVESPTPDRQAPIQAAPAPTTTLPPEPAVTIVIRSDDVTSGTPVSTPLPVSVPKKNDEPKTDIVKAPTASAAPVAAVEDFRAKPEVVNTPDRPPVHNESPKPVMAAQEPVPAEKTPTQAVRTVALEFAPDGAGDVRVRVAERGGEVHVSLHSADPSVVRSLRDGATDLAGILASAGYDARAWTSGRRQDENAHQREEQAPQRRVVRGVAGFEDILQQDIPQEAL